MSAGRWVACVVAVVTLLGCGVHVPPAAPAPQPPGPLEMLLASPHGSSRGEAALAELRRDPASAAAALDARFPANELQLIEHADSSFERAVLLLDVLDHPAADRLLARWFLDLHRVRRASPNRPAYDRLALAHLAGAYDAAVVERLLGELEGRELSDRLSALLYLVSVAPGHREIRAALQAAYDKPTSPLYRDELLGRALELIVEKGRPNP